MINQLETIWHWKRGGVFTSAPSPGIFFGGIIGKMPKTNGKMPKKLGTCLLKWTSMSFLMWIFPNLDRQTATSIITHIDWACNFHPTRFHHTTTLKFHCMSTSVVSFCQSFSHFPASSMIQHDVPSISPGISPHPGPVFFQAPRCPQGPPWPRHGRWMPRSPPVRPSSASWSSWRRSRRPTSPRIFPCWSMSVEHVF